MRVAQLVARHEFQLIEETIPDPGPGEVQARVHSVGVCGSDLHNFSEGSVGDSPSLYPMVLGHEPAGTVVKTGPGVTGWSSGDQVMLEPAIYCYHCEFCRSGRYNVCENIRFLSQPGDPGYFRDYVNVPVQCLVPMPRELSFDVATLFEPLAVVVHAMKLAALALEETAAVLGAGPIGLMTVACLKLAGARRVYAVEPVGERRDLARQLGADCVIDPAEADAGAAILADTGKRGVDLAIDCVMRGGSLDHCLTATRNAGRVVVTGIPPEVRVDMNFHTMRRKEIHLYNCRRSNHETEAAVSLLTRYPKLFGPIVTHTRPIEEIQAAFELNEVYADGVGKMVIRLA